MSFDMEFNNTSISLYMFVWVVCSPTDDLTMGVFYTENKDKKLFCGSIMKKKQKENVVHWQFLSISGKK